jgi:hypothetical protein
MKEFKQYLEGMEKDLSRVSKKFSNREIAQTVGLVANGIHEALNYLAIVKKVIEKTERAVSTRSRGSNSVELPTGGDPSLNDSPLIASILLNLS